VADESPSEALIRALEHGGELVDHATFTLDPAAALAKLQAALVADPHQYLLAWVEAAVLSGVTRVVVAQRRGSLALELGPHAYAREQLAELHALLFSSRGDAGSNTAEHRRHRVLQQLARGCTAALRLEFDEIRIESIAGDRQGFALSLTHALPLGRVSAIAGEPGTRVKIRRDPAGELEQLRTRCTASSIPILLDDEPLSRELLAALDHEAFAFGGVVASAPLVGAPAHVRGVVGRMGQRRRRGSGRVTVVCNGVTMASIEHPALATDRIAIVEADLPRDLGHAHLREGPELDAALALVLATTELQPVPRPKPPSARPPSRLAELVVHSLPVTAAAVVIAIWLSSEPRLLFLVGVLVWWISRSRG
jgi:hypothetical protein